MTPLALLTLSAVLSTTDQRALIIGNNGSPTLGRPSLQYADDDAVRYRLTYGLMLPENDITLLARYDRDTEQLTSKEIVPSAPPTRGAVLDALATLERTSQDAKPAASVSR